MSNNRTEREIYMPTSEERTELEKEANRYTTAEIKCMASPYRKFAKQYHLYAIDKQGKKYYPAAIEGVLTKETTFKSDWIAFYSIMSHPNNYHILLDQLSERELALLRAVLLNQVVNNEEANSILGTECFQKEEGYWSNRYKLNKNLKVCFNEAYAKGLKQEKYGSYHITVPYVIAYEETYQRLLPILFPELKEMTLIEDLPQEDSASLTIYSGEANIFTLLPMLSSLYESKQIEMGKSKVTASTIKKAAKILQPNEFFKNDDKGTECIAANFLINSYCLYRSTHKYKKDSEKNEDLIKDILFCNNHQSPILIPILLPHISGFRKIQLEYGRGNYLFTDIQTALLTLDEYGWIPINKLCFRARTFGRESIRHFVLLSSYEFDKMTLVNNFYNTEVFIDGILREITYPLVKSYLFMMAALGLVEIAYKEVRHFTDKATSCFDGLKYVRLTNLGKYALGLNKEYVRTKQKDIKYFELDKESLIVKSLAEVNPYESILTSMGKAISKKMYKLSYETFLDGCASKSDITNKIQLFHDYICPNPPVNWEQFFKDMEDKCKLMKAPQKKYSLLQIPSDRKDLQRILLSDPEIRKYSIKAEGYILLVETNNKNKVVEALKKYGYLL